MKPADIGGGLAAIGAGFMIGRDYDNGEFPTTDIFIIAGLIGLAWYLSVYLS